MAVILRRMLRIGKLPADMRANVESEGIVYLAEFVPVTFRFSGSVPGFVAKGNIRSYSGALVLTSQRVLGTLSTVPKVAGRAIDQRWDAAQAGPVKAEFSEGGLALDVDVSQVDPAVAGVRSAPRVGVARGRHPCPEACVGSQRHVAGIWVILQRRRGSSPSSNAWMSTNAQPSARAVTKSWLKKCTANPSFSKMLSPCEIPAP